MATKEVRVCDIHGTIRGVRPVRLLLTYDDFDDPHEENGDFKRGVVLAQVTADLSPRAVVRAERQARQAMKKRKPVVTETTETS